MDEETPERSRRPWRTDLRVPKKGALSLSLRDRLRLFPPIHGTAYLLTRLTGMRDRLRCPHCQAVGTWKMHGGWLDEQVDRWSVAGADDLRSTRRWLCKFCGYYIGPEGIVQAWPDRERGWWVLPASFDPESPEDPGETPDDVLWREMGATWPWRG